MQFIEHRLHLLHIHPFYYDWHISIISHKLKKKYK